MANDDHDNAQTDHERLDKLQEPATRGARIDIRTWPHSCEIYLNRPALDDLIAKLQTVVQMTLPATKTCVRFADVRGQTLLEISTDDNAPAS